VLVLIDDSAFTKAKDALLERWMSNEEWPKGVVSVALAYPLGTPAIEAVIERSTNPWTSAIRRKIYPQAKVYAAEGDSSLQARDDQSRPCVVCEYRLAFGDRFCSKCGAQVPQQTPSGP
jgi:hypothetical protein